jgi:putative hydrolase of the HAD superfamily
MSGRNEELTQATRRRGSSRGNQRFPLESSSGRACTGRCGYKAVVFDLWDTLVLWPSEDGHNFYRLMADHVGVPLDTFNDAWTELYDMRATGPLEPSVRAVAERLGLTDDRVESLMNVRIDWTRKVLVPRPGAVEVLDELRRRGYRLGLISVCSEEVPKLWEQTSLADRIDEAVFSCSVGVAKPDPRIYRIAADRLGVEPCQCLFVDDQPAFIEGAREAGMDAVLLGGEIESLEDVLKLAQ